jgi:branched-chain amino acid transport system substrate-binding protein
MSHSRLRDALGCLLSLVLGAAAVVIVTPAFAENGITDTEILIGVSAPLSGPNAGYSAISRGMQACFDYFNAEQNGVKFGDGKTRKVKQWSRRAHCRMPAVS